MSGICVAGYGAVSPSGWGVTPLQSTLESGNSLPTKPMQRPGWECELRVRQVPPANPRPAFLTHARLRRSSPITQYVVSAALEALGEDFTSVKNGSLRLGIVLCVMSGCVNYTRRFYDETLKDPATASPLIFPETVFNAPASHIATLLGTPAMNYSIVGDPGTFLQGLALGAQWLADDHVDGCLVLGGEECDWLTSDAFRHFSRETILSDGAGAIYLKKSTDTGPCIQLEAVTGSHLFTKHQNRDQAAIRVADELNGDTSGRLLCDSRQGITRIDAPETNAWKNWPGARISPKTLLGEGLMAASAWQCVLALEALKRGQCKAANISVLGCNQQAIGARFGLSN